MIRDQIWRAVMGAQGITDRGRLLALYLLHGEYEQHTYAPPAPGLGFIAGPCDYITRAEIESGALGIGGWFEVGAEMIRVTPQLIQAMPEVNNLGVVRSWARRLLDDAHIVRRSRDLVTRHMYSLRMMMGTSELLAFWYQAEHAVSTDSALPKHIKPPSHGVNVNARLRWEILERDGHRCVYCGATPGDAELAVDHVISVNDGGKRTRSNLATSCQPCNMGKGDRKLLAIPGGKR